MKQMVQRLDANDNPVFAVDFTDSVNTVVAGPTAKSVTVPSGAKFVVFSATGDFAADGYKTAVLYTSDRNDGTGSEMNPAIRDCKGIASISVIAPVASTYVTLSFYS